MRKITGKLSEFYKNKIQKAQRTLQLRDRLKKSGMKVRKNDIEEFKKGR